MTRLVRPVVSVVGSLAIAALIAGCASTDRRASDRATTIFDDTATTTMPLTTTTATTILDPQCDASNPARSLRPTGPLPAPGQMPPGSTMAGIQGNGTLKVAVDQNTLLFGYRNPKTGDLEGFDIDVAREVARAIFGDPTKIVFKVVTTGQRQDAVTSGAVDLVASLYTINCARWHEVAFSAEYYRAAQAVLVRNDSGITNISDLAGKRICVTSGSTASTNPLLATLQPKPVMVLAGSRTECLDRLQNSQIDAIVADDTILYGLQEQDLRSTKLLDTRLTTEPYGLAIKRDRLDFVRFVNGVLDGMRTDGRLEQLEAKWLGDVVDPPPAVPDASYRD
jgi:polar amino acid transport system substrate-binding protein